MIITIYLNAEQTVTQVIRPTKHFDGDTEGLVQAITGGRHFGFKAN